MQKYCTFVCKITAEYTYHLWQMTRNWLTVYAMSHSGLTITQLHVPQNANNKVYQHKRAVFWLAAFTDVQYFDWLLWRFELWQYIYKHHNCFRWFNLSPVLRNSQTTVIRFWLVPFRTCYDFLVDVISLGNSAIGHSMRKYLELPSRFSTKYHENAIFLSLVGEIKSLKLSEL